MLGSKKNRSRKGILFTLTVFIISLLVLLLFMNIKYDDYFLKSKIESIKINKMNEIYKNYKRYAEIAVITSTRQALDNISLEINATGNFLLNFRVLNATASTKINNFLIPLMNKIKRELANNSINVSYEIREISLQQQDSAWYIKVFVDMGLNMSTNIADWKANLTKNISVPIDGLIDPLYLHTTGQIRRIEKSKYAFSEQYPGNYTKFLEFKNKGWYRATARAPSFLQRFYNDGSNSTYGIETMINESLVRDINRSYIDFMYVYGPDYVGENLSQLYIISGVNASFKLDEDSLSIYLGNNTDMATPLG